MKALIVLSIVILISLPYGIRGQTQSRKAKIQRIADRLGIGKIFE